MLPNTACLDERQIAALREYVRGGGGLVASLDTSLCDEFGTRGRISLWPTSSASRKGRSCREERRREDRATGRELRPQPDRPQYWEKRKNIFDLLIPAGSPFDEPRIRKLIGQDPVTFKGPLIPVKLTSNKAKVIATVATRTAGPVQQPAVIAHEFGKGRVVYFAAGIDAVDDSSRCTSSTMATMSERIGTCAPSFNSCRVPLPS